MNHEEWLEERRKSIGASDCASILNIGFSTPYQIWLSKVHGVDQPDNPAMARGRELEPIARAKFDAKMNTFTYPYPMSHTQIPWLKANLDCLNEQRIMAEIKCPMNHASHQMAIDGTIPAYYIPQLQHQLLCARSHHPEIEINYYVSYHPDFAEEDQLVIIPWKFDQSQADFMMPKLEEFWNYVVTKTPPPLTDRDYQYREDEEWKNFEFLWKETTDIMKSCEERMENLKIRREKLCNGKNTRGERMKVTYFFKQGAVDYASIPQLQDVDIEKYRKPPTQQCRVSIK